VPTMIETIRERLDDTLGRMQGIEDLAVTEQRDALTDVEQSTWDELHSQAETYAERLSVLASREEIDQRAAATLAKITRAAAPAERVTSGSLDVYASPGAYALDYMRMQQGDHQARQRLTRALADVTTPDNPGLVPPQVTGPVVGQWMANRPSVASYAKPPLPAVGMEIQRPHIAQHVLVDKQAAEKTQVATQKFTLDLLKCDLETWAGAVDVSWQLVERSSPAAIDLIFSDFVAVYARYSDLSAVISLAASIAQTMAWDGTAAGLLSTLAAAVVMATQNSVDQQFPDTIWLGLNAYAALVGLTSDDGRPMFPFLAPQNALGSADLLGNVGTIGGLTTVVDSYADPDTFIVGDRTAVEFYENPGAPVRLSVIDVGVLGYNIGVAGMWALLNTDPGSFVKVTFPPPAGTQSASRSGNNRKSSE
jgi:HK97 family phage major capsid protein